MKRIKLTVRHDRDGTLSLWLQSGGLSEHRASYELAENRDHADFYARVAKVRHAYEAEGATVTFYDETQ